MKKKLLALISMTMVVCSLVACGTSQSSTEPKNDKDGTHDSKIEVNVETTVEDEETEDASEKEVISNEETSKIDESAFEESEETIKEEADETVEEESKDEKVEMEGHGHKENHSIDSSDNDN